MFVQAYSPMVLWGGLLLFWGEVIVCVCVCACVRFMKTTGKNTNTKKRNYKTTMILSYQRHVDYAFKSKFFLLLCNLH